jgi:iron complex outermembrane recepter protein
MGHKNKSTNWNPALVCIVVLFLVCGIPASAQDSEKDISQISLEDLSKTQVTSVSKKEQKLADAATAVYVITASDIRHSTATNLPELLHDVPGLDVAQVNGNSWAISARGFAEQFSTKMLILIDGRNVFDPLFSGTTWSEQDMPLDEIERIEVIRGPGATMWGTNAMNGVINIITKPASETQGTLLSAGTGSELRSLGEARYGGRVGKGTEYRLFSRYFDEGPENSASGQRAHDSDRRAMVGMRVDSRLSDRDTLTVEGRGYNSSAGFDRVQASYVAPYAVLGTDTNHSQSEGASTQWQHKSINGSLTTLQADFSHVIHQQSDLDFSENAAGLSVQHEMPVGTRHDVLAGVEYQYKQAENTIIPNAPVWWNADDLQYSVASGFIQDEVLFRDGRIRITGGLRIDSNSLSGFSLDPSIRGLWKVARKHSFWAAYSLATRAVSLSDTGVNINTAAFPGPTGTVVLRYEGNPNIKPEKLRAAEFGYRADLTRKLMVDLATYYNRYSALGGNKPGQPFFEAGPPPRLVIPLVDEGNIWGSGWGGEAAIRYRPTHSWQVRSAHSYTKLNLREPVNPFGGAATLLQGQTPRNKVDLGSSYDFGQALTWNALASFVDRRVSGPVPGYTQFDSSFVWRPLPSTHVTLGVQNLFNKEHIEFVSSQIALPSRMGRTVYAKVTWGDSKR